MDFKKILKRLEDVKIVEAYDKLSLKVKAEISFEDEKLVLNIDEKKVIGVDEIRESNPVFFIDGKYYLTQMAKELNLSVKSDLCQWFAYKIEADINNSTRSLYRVRVKN